MPTSPIDWPAIRSAYEQGVSQRSLAREYGVSQPTISERASKEKWQRLSSIPPIIPQSVPISDREPQDILSIIENLLQKVAAHAQSTTLEPKDIKLLADAISQFHKIELTSASDKPTASGIASDLLPYLDMAQLDRLAALQAEQEEILELAKARKLETEQGIMSIKSNKKVG